MSIFKNLENKEVYTYQGKAVIIITVFKNGAKSIAIVEDENGEQYEVFRDQLHQTQSIAS